MVAVASGRFRACIALVLCAFAHGAACAAPLVVAVEDDAAPWSQLDGTGFANDLVRATFDAAGVDVVLEVVPYPRCKDMVIKGRAVACLSMSWLPEFAGKIVFADKPLFRCYVDYFVANNRPLKASSQQGLPKGTVVGIVTGYEYPPALYELQKKGIVVLQESDSEDQSLKKLAAGRIDTALVTHNETKPFSTMLVHAGVRDQVHLKFRSGINGSYIGFSTAHPDGARALSEFNRGHKLVLANGTYRKIEKRWRDRAQQEVVRLAARGMPPEQRKSSAGDRP